MNVAQRLENVCYKVLNAYITLDVLGVGFQFDKFHELSETCEFCLPPESQGTSLPESVFQLEGTSYTIGDVVASP